MWSRWLIFAALVALIFPAPSRAAELVLFETAGCPYCIAWDRDVGKIYHLTDEARLLKLRRVDLQKPLPADLETIEKVRITPTFVVMDRGREVGRIVGYLGDDQFWDLLGEFYRNLDKKGG